MALAKNRLMRSSLFVLGVLSVVAGIVGAVVPVVPTTPFILLAAWCFLKSSVTAHQWLYRQPLFGKALKNWEMNQSISRGTKVLAVAMIIISLIFIWLKVGNFWVKTPVTALLLAVSLFISTRDEPDISL